MRDEVFPVCSGPFIPLKRGGLLSVQWAPHPSWERRFTWCAVGPASLLREEVYPVCSGPFLPLERGGLYLVYSGPFVPLERGGLPSVQSALHHSWERRFTQCVVGPSSVLKEEVYPVCSGPFIPLERGDLPSVQWALHHSWERRFTQYAVGPSSLLREEVYPVCSGSLIPPEREVYLVCSGPFITSERGGLSSVQWALQPSWERRFTECAVGPSFLLRDDRGAPIVCSGPSSLTEPERWNLPSMQPAPHPREMKITSVHP